MPSDDIAIRVEGLGKRYLVPQKHVENYSRAPTLKERLKEFFPGLLGADETDFFWALRDVSFEVKRGEVLGVVGENGSGKSTLLKILSGVTPPTEGIAEIRGRVGSLLEVGTGFHPDLTGRENILFNGSLLGISVSEVRSKLDAIIEFSGIGEFIDVPVKRYSSGMYVRLAYAVASLLQSEIMILDEVLAVGDASFRSKSEQNIKETASGGRTVLLVSHNPQSIATICDKAIILHEGRVVFAGSARDVIADYLTGGYLPDPNSQNGDGDARSSDGTKRSSEAPTASEQLAHVTPSAYADISHSKRPSGPGWVPQTRVLKWVKLLALDGTPNADLATGDGLRIQIGFSGIKNLRQTYFSAKLQNTFGVRMTTVHSTDSGHDICAKGEGVVECLIPELMLADGLYSLMVDTGTYDAETRVQVVEDCVEHVLFLRVTNRGFLKGIVHTDLQGSVHRSEWRVT